MAEFKYFYGLEIPESLLKLGFVDESFPHEGAARMAKGEMSVWVSEADPVRRPEPDYPRFHAECGDLLWTGESEAELIAWIEKTETRNEL